MKKLAILAAASVLSLAAPVFACPGMDHDSPNNTAAKDAPKKDTSTAATKDADKPAAKDAAKAAKPAAKDGAKDAPKKDKVSMK
jgi:hypothetical protein